VNKQAVIFDMDGVITDSEPLYSEAVNLVLAKAGASLTDEDHRAIMGSSIDFTWQYVIDRFGLEGTLEDWKPSYDHAVVELLSSNVIASDGLGWLLNALKSLGIRIGLATSSQRNWVEAVLSRLAVTDAFDAIATTEMVEQAKPAPDVYLLAATKLGIGPERCIAIEDTPRGIASAKSAGMFVIAVRTGSTAQMDVSAADQVIDNLGHFEMDWLSG